MELLTELWDKTTDAFTAVTEHISDGLVRVFGNSNERQIRRMRPIAARINELEPENRKMIFDPIPRVDGIEPSDDPLFDVRAALYLLGGRRRRAAVAK